MVSCSYVWDNPYDPNGIGKTPGIKYDASLVGDSLGNSDGAINPGEAIKLDIRVHNISSTDYGTVEAVLSSTSSYVTMSTTSFTYGDIPSRKYASVYVNNNTYGTSPTATDIAMNANATGAFAFIVSASTPAGTVLPFTLTFTDSSHNTWTDNFELTVVASSANLVFDASLVSDTTGNNNGAINPGEAVRVDIRVQNSGGSNAVGLKAVLSSASSYVTMSTTSFTYGEIPAGKYASVYFNGNNYGTSATATDIAMNANATGAYRFSVSASTPAGTELPFTLTFTDSQNNTWTDTFSLTVVSSTTLSWSFTSAPAGFTGTWYLSASKWRSAVIGNNGTSTTSVTFTASARVNALVAFTYGGDSEASCDRIHFSIDGNEQTLFPDSGRLFTGTFSQTASLASGSHTLQFWYSKDESQASGGDYVWINSLSISY